MPTELILKDGTCIIVQESYEEICRRVGSEGFTEIKDEDGNKQLVAKDSLLNEPELGGGNYPWH